MSYPFDDKENEFNKITREQLDSMSVAELLELLESINETMTEDNFDDELVEACLDAIDRKSPMPEYPSTDESLKAFETKLRSVGGTEPKLAAKHSRHRFIRIGLVAAITAACLFCGMIAVQAAGVDVFGIIARWTDSVFGFSEDAEISATQQPERQFIEQVETWLPLVPDGFVPDEPTVMSDEYSGVMRYSQIYWSDEDHIAFEVILDITGSFSSIYEKDDNAVKTIHIGNVPFYIFSNNDAYIAAWSVRNLEFTVSTDTSVEMLEELIVKSYGG